MRGKQELEENPFLMENERKPFSLATMRAFTYHVIPQIVSFSTVFAEVFVVPIYFSRTLSLMLCQVSPVPIKPHDLCCLVFVMSKRLNDFNVFLVFII
jgi:hypothetical protein